MGIIIITLLMIVVMYFLATISYISENNILD